MTGDGRWVMEKDAAGPPTPTHIHYLELGGEGAQATLTALLEPLRLCPGFVDAALLHSQAQGLWLLESRWQGTPTVPSVPAGAKAWAFAVVTFVKD